MRIHGVGLRKMYADLSANGGPQRFVNTFRSYLGLGDTDGRNHFDTHRGRNVLESQTLRPDDCSMRTLALSIVGEDAGDLLGKPRDVLEAGGGTAIVPSTFANISAFNSAVAGLLEAKVLESYGRPEFIADQLVETIPSNKRKEKFIGVSTIGDVSETRKPGRVHARAELSEQYVETPETVNRGIGIDVTNEAVMFDLTRQILDQANSVGETLALRKEYLILDVVLGITNTYTYNGTSYNTYVGSGGLWANALQNPFATQSDYDDALQLFVAMTDPTTGEPINVAAKQVLCMPAKWQDHAFYLAATDVEKRTATTQADVAHGRNPFAGMFQLVAPPTYPYAYKRAIAADGLNFAEANAKGVWYLGDFKRAFAWVQNLPLTVKKVNAPDYEMADRGLVLSVFADEMGVAAVKDPRFVVRNQVQAF